MCPAPKKWIAALATIFLTVSTGAQPDSCPVFGTDQSTNLSRSTEERVFLNFEAPSQCRGNVTSWRYCHYTSGDGDEADDDIEYRARFIVYRRADPTSESQMYHPVGGSITTMSLRYSDVRMGFRCLNETISQTFEIQENDVIGACVWDLSDIHPLYLIGDDSNTDQKLYQYNRMKYQRCMDTQLGTVDTEHGSFVQRRQSTLHLYANIDVAAFCRAGSNPSATGPATGSISGTYLNTNNAAMCSDHITSWNYCYYPPVAPAGQTYTMTVAAWRLDAGTYRLIQGTSRSITLNPVATLAKIFCIEETLDPVDYVLVSEEDVIGVVLPSINPIPVVSTNASSGSSLMMHSQSTGTTDLLGSQFITLSNSSLHVYAKIEFVFVPTVTPATSMPGSTTTTAPTGGTSGSSPGTIAAVTILVIMVCVAVLITAMVLFRLFWKRHQGRKSDLDTGIDNATYHMTTDEATTNGPMDYEIEKTYESVAQDYLAPAEAQIGAGVDQIYQEVDEGDGIYYAPVDSLQDYQDCLKEVLL